MTANGEASTVDTTGIWFEFRERLLGFITRRVNSPHDAEDILQEVMLRIHRHRTELDRVHNISAWVYRIARNAITDHYRRPAGRELPAGDDLEPTGWDGRPPDQDYGAEARTELATCLRPMLERLPLTYQQAILLTEFEGVTQAAAAAQLGLSVSGMKTRVQRARRQLKQILLDCCHVNLDPRGGVNTFQARDPTCAHCGRERSPREDAAGGEPCPPPGQAGHSSGPTVL